MTTTSWLVRDKTWEQESIRDCCVYLNDVVMAIGGDSGGFFDFFEAKSGFRGRIRGFVEDAFGFAEAALHDEPPRRFGHGEDADGEYDGRYGSDAEHESPAELQREL